VARSAAKRYAQAALSLAKERGTLDAWHDDLRQLSNLMADEGVRRFLGNPNPTEEQKLAVLDGALANGQPETKNLVRLLLSRDRINEIPDIAELFEAGIRGERGIVVAEVTTADPLDDEARAMIKQRLEAVTGKTVDLKLTVDPSLIGGIVAKIGDQLIDGSVVSQLRRLRARLAASA
jgi:F-type H+-transporting ATPase subunit delta